MNNVLSSSVISAETAVERLQRFTGSNGLRYALLGHGVGTTAAELPHLKDVSIQRLVNAVPASLATALQGTTYAFVPLALSGARLRGDNAADAAFQSNDPTLVADHATPELTERAICHRNAEVQGADYVFLSALLHRDSFALAFEFFINVAHDLVDIAGMPASFATLLDEQTSAGVRGETSMDAWEHRIAAFGPMSTDDADTKTSTRQRREAALAPPLSAEEKERARRDYQHAAFADAVAIYLLSLFLDFDYADLRERGYPLLQPQALAARLRAVNANYPPNDSYSFQVLYRRRP